MSVRIIAGTWRGRRLQTPPGKATRPLLDRIKQSLFDRLGQDLTGLSVLDCCGGSGSFAFEAASRGASAVHVCEPAPAAIQCLQSNWAALDKPAAVHLHAMAYEQVMPRLKNIDLVFADPPFPWFVDAPERLQDLLQAASAVVATDGRVLLRGEKGQALPPLPPQLQLVDERRYGRSWVAFIEPVAEPECP